MPIPRGEVGKAILDKYFKGEQWEDDSKFSIYTGGIKAISDYSKMPFTEILNLPYSYYLLLKKEAWISNLRGSEEGREFLKTLWTLQQTKPQMDKVRSFMDKQNT